MVRVKYLDPYSPEEEQQMFLSAHDMKAIRERCEMLLQQFVAATIDHPEVVFQNIMEEDCRLRGLECRIPQAFHAKVQLKYQVWQAVLEAQCRQRQ